MTGYGTLFDLDDGSLDIYGPGGRVFLSGKEGQDLFRITNNTNVNLLKMNNEEYYLQSSSYLGKAPLSIIRDGITYYLYSNSQSSIKNGNDNLNLS
jgi:hypothetical protein